MKLAAILVAVLALGCFFLAFGSPSHSSAKGRMSWEYLQITGNYAMPDFASMQLPENLSEDQKKSSGAFQKVLKQLMESNERAKTEFDGELKKAGQDGWELVTITQMSTKLPGAMLTIGETAYLKRQSN